MVSRMYSFASVEDEELLNLAQTLINIGHRVYVCRIYGTGMGGSPFATTK